jgi:DNA-binding NarL/FixJ family response regulator
MIRILMADDHAIVREGLNDLISYQPDMEVVGEASNGRKAVAMYAALMPDVTLMDISMPVMDGIAATAAITKLFPDACIVILSSTDERQNEAMAAGASMCILKEIPGRELLAMIRQVASRCLTQSPVLQPA